MDGPSTRPPEPGAVALSVVLFRGALTVLAALAAAQASLSGDPVAATLLWVVAVVVMACALTIVPAPSGTDHAQARAREESLAEARAGRALPAAGWVRPLVGSVAQAYGNASPTLRAVQASLPARCLRRWQMPIDIAVISVLVYVLSPTWHLLALAYSVPIVVAALRSVRFGVAAVAGSATAFLAVRGLHLSGVGPARPAIPPAGLPYASLAEVAMAVVVLVGATAVVALVVGSYGEACRRALAKASGEVERWRGEAGRLEAVAGERAEVHGRLEKLLRSRSAPTLQVAHQLRAPIAAIQSCLDVVLQGYAAKSVDQQRRLLQSARDAAAEMLALTSDVLRLGELREAALAPRREPVDIGEVATRVAEAYRGEALLKAIQLAVDIAPGLPSIPASRIHLEELFRNLLDNAIKYSTPEGKVWLKLWLENGVIRGEVGDTGIGIREKDLARIFEEFFRADNAKEVVLRGTGLGLPIVKQVVELYGGSIEVRSKLGEGTTFTFTLPVAANASASVVVGQVSGDGQDETG